ncbi:hypothetical protein K7I13_08300 [Brucepastera parasyntrophica]|uniref:hypothetical protein n=1 Tax=Brucepastera parasyntrophica TaxID=2880008 RepID=UPI002109C2F1|nr:hypothetical protein [Brucepastera parasyntrophica]ULQ58570.1 hypothetical protein K7I13_08300 [Brucepastera parasyntrophica]
MKHDRNSFEQYLEAMRNIHSEILEELLCNHVIDKTTTAVRIEQYRFSSCISAQRGSMYTHYLCRFILGNSENPVLLSANDIVSFFSAARMIEIIDSVWNACTPAHIVFDSKIRLVSEMEVDHDEPVLVVSYMYQNDPRQPGPLFDIVYPYGSVSSVLDLLSD